jgi:hypothetical protein
MMNETPDCQSVSPLLAELATGAATGHDRADVVRHVAGCPACRHEVAELARVADDLLLLIPEREPPPGFETAVAQRIANLTEAHPRGRRDGARPGRLSRALPRLVATVSHRLPARVVRLAAVAVVLAVTAAGGAAAAYWQSASDRHLADRYRQTVTALGYPTATPLTSTTGAVVGHLFLYQGSPSWAMVAITDAPESGNYSMVVLTTSGYSYSVGVCDVTGRTGTAGYPLTVSVAQIAAIELSRPGIRLTAHPS